MTVLISGGSGFIGSHLVDHLLAVSDADIRVLDNFSTGTKEQEIPVGAAVNLTPAVVDGVAYVADAESKLHAFDLTSQDELWSFNTDGYGGNDFDGAPTIFDGILYIASNDDVFALDKSTGDIDWHIELESLDGYPDASINTAVTLPEATWQISDRTLD